MNWKRSHGIALALCFLAAPGSSQTEVLTTDRDSDQLRVVDIASGVTQTMVTITLGGFTVNGSTGLAQDPSNGDLYALIKVSGAPRRLATVNPSTGVATDVGDTGDSFAGIAFDSSGLLYGVTGDGATTATTLYTLSKVNGSPTFVMTLGNGNDGEAIGWNPDDSLIYHGSGFITLTFESVDPIGMTTTNIGTSGAAYNEMTDLVYMGGGTFLMANRLNVLYTMTTGGLASSVSTLDHTAKGIVLLPTASLAFCFGDGAAVPCPCGNTGGPGEGCANTTGSGCILAASGRASVSNDSFVLTATQSIPGQPGLFFQGTANLGAGIPFGDGLRCCGGQVIRWTTVQSDASGCSSTDQPGGCGTMIGGIGGPISVLGMNQPGQTLCYQYWYRDTPGLCFNRFNLSNGIEVTWTP